MKYTGEEEDLGSGIAYTSSYEYCDEIFQIFIISHLSTLHGHGIPHVLLSSKIEITKLKLKRNLPPMRGSILIVAKT